MNALIMWIGISLILFLASPFIIRLLTWAARKWLEAWEPILYSGKWKEEEHESEKSMGSSTLD